MPRKIGSVTGLAAKPSQYAQDLLAATEKLAAERIELHREAMRLNTCIEQFEAWVAKLPGRVATTIDLPHPNPAQADADFLLLVRVAREGKRWPVTIAFHVIGDDPPCNWKPLIESSIELKLYAIPHLPRLIVDMAEAQIDLRSKIKSVVDDFEDFATRVGIAKEGE